MYELFILSLLMRQPMHGYLLARILNDAIGPYAKASHGRIYPLLAKLVETELLEARDEETGGRPARRFAITPRGQQRFRQLMMDTTSNPREYRELFAFKVSALDLLAREEREFLLDHYATFCQAHVLHLTSEMADMQAHREGYGLREASGPLEVMGHVRQQWELELAWARRLRERETSGDRKE